jgi:cyclopropane fatty-acyl-phospholipid synthase-like methyltransferase
MSLSDRLTLPEFPRSNGYDPTWVIAGCMGPNPLWLLEDLAADLRLEPGMRVLDLGCGRARTSVFLAREYGVTVWAADLWISPTENLRHVTEAGVADAVFPIRAEAHDLPFADGYFDAVVSVDAYQYFGTDDLYIGYLCRFLQPGGQVGIAVPALTEELGEVPERLRPYWEWEFACLHTADWWRRHWGRTGLVEVTAARAQPNGWRHWQRWSEVCAEASDSDFVRDGSRREAAMHAVDQGRTLTFALVVGQLARAPEVTS